MDNVTKNPMDNEEDKFKKRDARTASENEEDSKFLNRDSLDDDLTDIGSQTGEDGRILDPEHPENQEWNTREEQNKH